MSRTFAAGAAALGLVSSLAAPAAADIPDAPPELVARIAGGCRPGDAFGHGLGQAYDGARFVGVAAEHRPFRTLTVRTSPRSHRVVGVDLDAWHDDEAGSIEEKTAAAVRLIEALDTETGRQGHFPERTYDEETDTITWRSSHDEATGTRFDIARLGVGVYLTCQDLAMEALATDEMLGRTRVERPVRPVVGPRPRFDPADCADGGKVDALLERFETQGGGGMLDAVKANQEYFEHLADWYGQQLIDAGVWDQDRKMAFLMSLLEDPVLARGLEEQMGRLEPMMEAMLAYTELRGTGDKPGACRAAVRGLDALWDISAASEPQWVRAAELYKAEAARLGVTLED